MQLHRLVTLAALSLGTALSGCAATEAAAPAAPVETIQASNADKAAVSKLLQKAATGSADKAACIALVNGVSDAALRARLAAFIPELLSTADKHARIVELSKSAAEVGGGSQLAPGGPSWLRSISTDADMKLFDRLIELSFWDRKLNSHSSEKLPGDPKLWAQKLHGMDDLVTLNFVQTTMNDEAVAMLPPLPNLETLHVDSSPITDAAIPHFAKYTKLRQLFMSSNKKLHGHELAKLAGLENLTLVNLHSTGIDDETLRQLSSLPAIESLALGHGDYGNKGVEYLGTITRLKFLHVAATNKQMTPAGLAPLAKLVNLESLSIYDGLATDESAAFISNLPNLTMLNFHGPFTDAAVPHLEKLTQLKKLTLGGHKLTPAGIERLKKALPHTEITGA